MREAVVVVVVVVGGVPSSAFVTVTVVVEVGIFPNCFLGVQVASLRGLQAPLLDLAASSPICM